MAGPTIPRRPAPSSPPKPAWPRRPARSFGAWRYNTSKAGPSKWKRFAVSVRKDGVVRGGIVGSHVELVLHRAPVDR